jgi:hypothetical protein
LISQMTIYPFDESLAKKQMDELIAGKRKFAMVQAGIEFNQCADYLDSLGYEFDSWLDNPEEAVIEFLQKKRSES